MPLYEVKIVSHYTLTVEAPSAEDAQDISAHVYEDDWDFSYSESNGIEEVNPEDIEGLNLDIWTRDWEKNGARPFKKEG